MELSFRSISIESFKCFTLPVTVDFASLPCGLHFVRGINEVDPELGANAVGKTSLFDAVCWCLYGRTVDGLRNPDVRPWNSDGLTRVTLDLIRDGSLFRVERTTPNNSLTVNGEIIGQQQIDHEIMSCSVFSHTILLGQGRPLFFDLTPQWKMDLFVDVLDLNRWDVRSRIASDEVKRLTEKQIRWEAELDATARSIMELEELFETVKQEHREWNNAKKDRLASAKKTVANLQKKTRQLTEDLTFKKTDMTGIQDQLELLNKRLDEEQHDLHEFEKLQREETVRKAHLEKRLFDLKGQYASLGRATSCPTCGQKVSRSNLARHRNELSETINDLVNSLEHCTNELLKNKDAVDMMTDCVNGTTKVLVEEREKLDQCIYDSHLLDRSLAEVTVQVKEAERFVEMWSAETSPHKVELDRLKVSIVEGDERCDVLRLDLDKLSRRIDRVKFWVNGFKQCRLYLLEEILDELRLVSNSIGPELGLDGWYFNYEVERETKSGGIKRGLVVTITPPYSQRPVRWENFSGGEQQRLRLVGALSLSEVLLSHAGITPDLEILDEPTRHLSAEGIDDLCECLPARARRLARRTMYVDHHAMESSSFSSVLTLIKKQSGVLLGQVQ